MNDRWGQSQLASIGCWITDKASPLTVGDQAPTGWRSSCALYVPELQNDADFGPFMRIDTMPDLPV